MSRLRISMAALALAALCSALFVTGRRADAQGGAQLVCYCEAVLSSSTTSTCTTCPTITFSNPVYTNGKCAATPPTCGGASTRSCRIIGTFSEDCGIGWSDEPFELVATCLSAFDHQIFVPFACTGGGGDHNLQLNCKQCKKGLP